MRRQVFADTSYWVALTDKNDDMHKVAQLAFFEIGDAQILTTEAVVIEVVNFFSRSGDWMRQKANYFVRQMIVSPEITVLPSNREMLMSGLSLHAQRPDKNYSLTDCISMQVMRELGIFEILTHDHHFAQEGFIALMRSAS